MEQRREDNLVEEVKAETAAQAKQKEMNEFLEYLRSLGPVGEPKKSGKGSYERKSRGSYKKHKLDKKITVKHFLNERVNLNKISKKESEFMDSTPLHPIYVQIIFMGKNTTIRSAVDEICSSQDCFEELMLDDYYGGLFDREKCFIEYYVKNYYDNYLKSEKDSLDKDLDDDEIEYYTSKVIELKDIMVGFDYYDHEINVKVDRALKAELLSFAKEITLSSLKPCLKGLSKSDKQEAIDLRMLNFKFINDALEFPEKKISALELLCYYEQMIPTFKEMRDRFSPQIWSFNIYYSDLVDNGDNQYKELGATVIDFLHGDFKQQMCEYFTDDSKIAQNIIKDIESFNKNKNLKI